MSEGISRLNRPPSRVQQIGQGLILALLLARYFDVTESAAQGDTLWIVGLWFVGMLFWLIVSSKSTAVAGSFGWLDLGVVMLAGGHLLSALVIICTSGEKRSAINLAWEWSGVLVSWFLLRCEFRDFAFRREVLIGILATGTSAAGLGLYQHYVDFPQTAAKYGPLFERLKHADPAEAANIREALARDQIPIDGPGVTLFAKRLSSREPLGLFALANTFGGFLAVCLILAVSIFVSNRQSGVFQVRKRQWLWMIVIVLLAWCLLLTKSRTAWIGTAAGLVVWTHCTGQLRITRTRVIGFATSLLILAIIGWGLGQIGGLDKQVLTEAPKSLQYRLQYWSATCRMIKEHLWLGVGPGQFRSHYLFYKLPAASEEISDPHNLFLDVMANGGLMAAAGLCMVLVCLFRNLRIQSDNANRPSSLEFGRLICTVIFGLAAIAWCLLLITSYDDRLLVLLPLSVGLFWGFRRILGPSFADRNLVRFAALSAAFSLIVHLLGAGGIGMPAVSLLLLTLIAIADHGTADWKTNSPSRGMGRIIFLVVLGLGGVFGLYITAFRPVALAQANMLEGDRLAQKREYAKATSNYRMAAAADQVYAEPWRRQAQMEYYAAQADRFRSNDSFANAVRLMREAGKRDPGNFHDDQTLGDWWLAKWRVTKNPQDANEAALALGRACARYPTNAMLKADFVTALEAAGELLRASEVAVEALQQDELNHQRGHVDRFLDDSTRLVLEKLVHDPAND